MVLIALSRSGPRSVQAFGSSSGPARWWSWPVLVGLPRAVAAIEDVDTQAALCVVKILERKAALLGLDQPTKLDVVQVQAQQAPDEFDKIYDAIMRVARRNGQQSSDGNGSDPAAGNGDGGNGNGNGSGELH